MKKLWPSYYFRPFERGLVEKIRAMVESSGAAFIFLNQVNLASIAAELRSVISLDCRIVVLSHGLESTDLLHALRLKSDLRFTLPRYVFGEWLLGDTLLREVVYRSHVDLVLCLSPFDVELERWLGARSAAWVPRTITRGPLTWIPHGNRVGFVGTLDHPPNLEGLLIFLRNLSTKNPSGVRIRVVGGPDHLGRRLMEQFSMVDYLGSLSEDALIKEASTWNCFAHPIFCYPRGCSTKLATAISWQIPIVTTVPGCRGYIWSQGKLSIADGPDQFSDLCIKMMDDGIARQARTEVSEVAKSSPSIASTGRTLASILQQTERHGGTDTSR
jgi:hypothetical protein